MEDWPADSAPSPMREEGYEEKEEEGVEGEVAKQEEGEPTLCPRFLATARASSPLIRRVAQCATHCVARPRAVAHPPTRVRGIESDRRPWRGFWGEVECVRRCRGMGGCGCAAH